MRVQKNPPDFTLIFSVAILLCIGIIMVFSSSSVAAFNDYKDAYYFLKKQIEWAIIGTIAMIFCISYPIVPFIKKHAETIFIITVMMLIVVLVPGLGTKVKGSARWIGVGPFTLQPTEVMKIALVSLMAKSLSNKKAKITSFREGMMPHLIILCFVVALVMLQPDLGTVLVLASATYLMLIAAGSNKLQLGGLVALGVGAIWTLIAIEPYRMRRITAFLDPFAQAKTSGFQTVQSLLALGSGGLFGVGLGNSGQKFLYLPERHTDFIFGILGEELGFLGALVVLILFALVLWRGVKIALDAPDTFSGLLAAGLTFSIVTQAILNIGVVSGTLPVTGVTLPFISYGGSSLLFTMIAVGIILNISRSIKL